MTTTESNAEPRWTIPWLRWAGILAGLVIPTLITLVYFVLAAELSGGMQQSIYLAVKIVQFAFPAVWVLFVLREPAGTRTLAARGWLLGVVFSLVVVTAGWALFTFALRSLPQFAHAAELVRDKLSAYGIDSVWKYAVLAIFYSLLHSLLEEYYWRWFLFGQFRKVANFWPAAAITALFFAAHHVIVLVSYFGAKSPAAWLLSAAVAVGGVFWAWLYERSHSLVGPWLSHLLIDAGIFWIGYELVRQNLL